MSEVTTEAIRFDHYFRDVLGSVPTSVSVITSLEGDRPVGLVVGTFTSISLDPCLVGFFVDRKSTTWPSIRNAGRFAVNVLGSEDRELCATFAMSGGDKFSNVEWRRSAYGLPKLAAGVVYVEARIKSVHELGDHFLVVGAVDHLERRADEAPLVFWLGGLCSTSTPVAAGSPKPAPCEAGDGW